MSDAALHVVFGGGPVGRAVTVTLLAKDKRVRLINRSGQADFPEEVEVFGGDAADIAFACQACEGASVVYNALNAPYDKWPEMFPALQAGVLAGAASSGAKLVSMDNLYMYGPTGGQPITEETPYRATADKCVTRARMAEALMAAHKGGHVRVAIGRASDFFGPGVLTSAMGKGIFYPALEGLYVYTVGNPGVPHTLTYVPDIGRALVLLGERGEALGQVWHIPSPRTVTTHEFLKLVFDEAGQDPPVRHTSKWMIKLMGLYNPMLRELGKTLYQFEEPFIMDHSKFERTFDFHATPLEEAVATTVAWYRDHPRE